MYTIFFIRLDIVMVLLGCVAFQFLLSKKKQMRVVKLILYDLYMWVTVVLSILLGNIIVYFRLN